MVNLCDLYSLLDPRLLPTKSLNCSRPRAIHLGGLPLAMMVATAVKLSGDLFNIIAPTLQCSAHLVGVLGAIVHTSNAAFMSALVIKHSLDDVWLYAELHQLR